MIRGGIVGGYYGIQTSTPVDLAPIRTRLDTLEDEVFIHQIVDARPITGSGAIRNYPIPDFIRDSNLPIIAQVSFSLAFAGDTVGNNNIEIQLRAAGSIVDSMNERLSDDDLFEFGLNARLAELTSAISLRYIKDSASPDLNVNARIIFSEVIDSGNARKPDLDPLLTRITTLEAQVQTLLSD